MKIEKIILNKQELVETDEGYELKESEHEEVPCVITNRALQYAKLVGEIKTSLVTDLVATSGGGKDLDDERILKAIYVGYIGGELLKGKKEPKYTFDEFLERYNDTTTARGTLYSKLIMAERDNNFAKGIEKSTKKGKGKGEKK